MTQQRMSIPLVIRGMTNSSVGGVAAYLQRVPFSDQSFDESWLQQLLFKHPRLLPIREMEPVFDNPIPIARELPTRAGPVDLLYINPEGFLTIVETKLWRNPEARRVVVAQIIDYAAELSLWSFEDLDKAVREAESNSKRLPLIEIIQEATGGDFDKQHFHDQVSQNLRRGRFLLLIVGDGIQEGVEKMVEFLQKTPQLGFNLNLVEMEVFRENPQSNDPLFVQPRIVTRTREVTRAVVEIKVPLKPPEVVVTLPPEVPLTTRRRRITITEGVFFEQLGKAAPREVTEFAHWVLDNAGDHDLEIDWKEAGPLLKYVDDSTDEFFTFGQLDREGFLAQTFRLYTRFEDLKLPLEICRDYFDEVARLIPGAKRREVHKKGTGELRYETILMGDNPGPYDVPPLAALVTRGKDWFGAIDKAIRRIREVLANR